MYICTPLQYNTELYLIVDSCDDGRSDPHANGEAAMEVLVEEERLNHSCEEEENSIDITTPFGITLILGEIDHQPACENAMCRF